MFIPIVFDYHHHGFCTGGLSERDALEVAISTWGDIKPVVHYSESRAEEKKDAKIRPHAHSDYVNGPVDDYGYDLDVMIEAKAKAEAAAAGEKESLNERLVALGLNKAAEAAKATADAAAAAAEAAAAAKENEKAKEAEKATTIYDFFQDDDGFM